MNRSRKQKNVKFGTVSIGGGKLPTETDKIEIEKDLSEKKEQFEKENPQKPKSTIKPIEAPLNISRARNTIDNEYIDLAKAYLKIPSNKEVTLVDFAKGVIKLFDDNVKLIKKISDIGKASSQINNRVLFSSDSGLSWN